jgi:hypothetical protein
MGGHGFLAEAPVLDQRRSFERQAAEAVIGTLPASPSLGFGLEPEGTRIARVDAGNDGATFLAYIPLTEGQSLPSSFRTIDRYPSRNRLRSSGPLAIPQRGSGRPGPVGGVASSALPRRAPASAARTNCAGNANMALVWCGVGLSHCSGHRSNVPVSVPFAIAPSRHRSNVPVSVPFAIAPSRTAVSASPVPGPSSAASCLSSAFTVKP